MASIRFVRFLFYCVVYSVISSFTSLLLKRERERESERERERELRLLYFNNDHAVVWLSVFVFVARDAMVCSAAWDYNISRSYSLESFYPIAFGYYAFRVYQA